MLLFGFFLNKLTQTLELFIIGWTILVRIFLCYIVIVQPQLLDLPGSSQYYAVCETQAESPEICPSYMSYKSYSKENDITVDAESEKRDPDLVSLLHCL